MIISVIFFLSPIAAATPAVVNAVVAVLAVLAVIALTWKNEDQVKKSSYDAGFNEGYEARKQDENTDG